MMKKSGSTVFVFSLKIEIPYIYFIVIEKMYCVCVV